MPNAINNVQNALQGMLDAHGRRHGDGGRAEKRREPRRVLAVPCEVCLFTGPNNDVVRVQALTSNLTFNGISIVAELPWPVPEKQAIEIIVDMPDATQTHLAGLVAFCSPQSGKRYNLGVEVKASCSNDILTSDLQAARKTYDWFDQALQAAS